MDGSKLKSVCKKEAESVHPGKVFCVKMRLRVFRKGVVLYLSRPAAQFKFVTSFGLIIVMMSGGVSAYAYDSPDVNATNFLYPVKQGLEGVERQFKFAPEDKIRFHVKIAKRRLSETETMKAHMDEMMALMGTPHTNPPEFQRMNQAIEQTMKRVQKEVDASFELTDIEMSPDRARMLLRDMQDDFALMRNHIGMMHDGETLEQIHQAMEEHMASMKDAASRIDRMAPRGKMIRLREILILRPTSN